MKKFVRNNLKIFITIIITTIVVGSIGVYANYKYTSSEVSYGNKNVKEAIDELYEKAELKPYDLAGIPIYYNPVNNTICNDYVEANSLNETKTGCLKWYIISGDRENITMILDHNTTYSKAWNTDNKNVSYEESNIKADIDALKTKSEWAIQPRLITAEEVKAITGNTTFDLSTSASWFYCFESNTKDYTTSPYCKQTAKNKYGWLFDNIKSCSYWGCNTQDNSSDYGYWTSTTAGTAGSGSRVGLIFCYGSLNFYDANSRYGIRPVITIAKSILN